MATNLDDGGDDNSSKRRTTRRSDIELPNRDGEGEGLGNDRMMRWRSATEQNTYSSKLASALLRQTSSNNPSSNSATYSKRRAVKETADRLLAAAAKGRTRWSRAILSNRIRLSLRNHRKATKVKSNPLTSEKKIKRSDGGGLLRKTRRTKKRLPALQTRVRDLGRLIPGCRKLPLPNLLDETTDYIAALEMQVRAMAALADFLAGAAAVGGGGEDSDRIGMKS